jgi:peptidoglycan/xylan/chitin deacetylase (PgdA/CDA1 family)
VSSMLGTGTARADGKWVARTIDDGPTPAYTVPILELLSRHAVKATFCVTGEMAREYPDLIRRIRDEGHLLCNHTMTHDDQLPGKSKATFLSEITRAEEAIRAAAPDVPIGYYRAPGGAWSTSIREAAAAHGMKSLGWSVDTRDWERPGVKGILTHVKRELSPGGVILVHDGGGNRTQTVAALRVLIPDLLAQGYQFGSPA